MFVDLVAHVSLVILVEILVVVVLAGHVDMVLVVRLLVIHVRRLHHLLHSWDAHASLL